MTKYLTFPDVAHLFNGKINKRFENVCRKNKGHTFFLHEDVLYAIRDGDFVICTVESKFTLPELLGMSRGRKLEHNNMVKCVRPLLASNINLFKVADPGERSIRPHSIERLHERLPVMRNKSHDDTKDYIMEAVKKGLENGDFFSVDDDSLMVIYKQMVYCMRLKPHSTEFAVYTSIRRHKLHLYALHLFKTKQVVKVPLWLVSKTAYDAIL